MQSKAWLGVGIGCFVVCLFLLGVAKECYGENASRVQLEAEHRALKERKLDGWPPSDPIVLRVRREVKTEPGVPTTSKYALSFAVVAGFGAVGGFFRSATGPLSHKCAHCQRTVWRWTSGWDWVPGCQSARWQLLPFCPGCVSERRSSFAKVVKCYRTPTPGKVEEFRCLVRRLGAGAVSQDTVGTAESFLNSYGPYLPWELLDELACCTVFVTKEEVQGFWTDEGYTDSHWVETSRTSRSYRADRLPRAAQEMASLALLLQNHKGDSQG